jgi:pimeloyl-ACP methyl ester carboxylesterase
MKPLMKTSAILLLLLISYSAYTQNIAKTDTGTVNCAAYKILIPENWKNKLVMFAHGYEFMGSPSAIEQPGFLKMANIFLERGFAVAASAYAYQGFALPQGVDDTEDLRQYFWDKYGIPDSTFMVGQSMGGGISVAMMENYSENYAGALAMCPLSSRPYLQTRKEFDARVLFEALFPGIVKPVEEVMDIHKDYTPLGYAELEPLKKALAEDPLKVKELARQFNLKTDDIPFTIFFGEGVLRDVALKCGGNPYDNTNTIYSGFSNDWEINQRVVRLKATASPDLIFEKYDRTGDIGKPVVLMHTIYDQLIPPQYGEVNFENMVHKQGKDHFLTVFMCNGQGHCNFTPEQIGRSFDELRRWVYTGDKARPEMLE